MSDELKDTLVEYISIVRNEMTEALAFAAEETQPDVRGYWNGRSDALRVVASDLQRMLSTPGQQRTGVAMSDELKAARERKHRWDADDDAAFDASGTDEENDMFMFGDAYLAEHPADEDEPITLNWWLSSGAETSLIDRDFMLIRNDVEGVIYLVTTLQEIPLPHIKTRGDVRRLCAALGIELTTRIDNTPAAK